MHHHRSNGFSVSGKRVTHKWKKGGGVRWYSMVWPRRKMKLFNDTIVTWVLWWKKHKIYFWTCYWGSTSIFFCGFSQWIPFQLPQNRKGSMVFSWCIGRLFEWYRLMEWVCVGLQGGGGAGGRGRSGESAHKFPKTNETLFSFGQQLCL